MYQLRDYQIDLVERTRSAYACGCRAPCVVAPCGAGKSVIIANIIKSANEKGNRVLFLVHRQELRDQIRETLVKNGVDLELTEVGMVQTVVKRLGKMVSPALIVTDENHHSLAGSYKKIYQHFNNALRLGFTATPVRLNGGGLEDVNDMLVEGPTVDWLIENRYLAPFKYYAPTHINVQKLKKQREYTKNEVEKMMKSFIYGDAIKHYKNYAEGTKTIVYCHSVKASEKTAEEFRKAGYEAVHFDANTKDKERKEIIEKFRSGEIKILCNVDLIGEGFDVPDCDTVILLRPTASLSLYIQQSMRSMRYREGKIAKIIDCVGNVERHLPPNIERQWTLKGIKEVKGKKEKNTVKTCENCYFVYSSKESKCPHCGYVAPTREIEIIEEAGLKELSEFKMTVDYRQPEDCKSLKELQDYAKNRGYKPGWAWYQWNLRRSTS